jgi:hypothetical protein
MPHLLLHDLLLTDVGHGTEQRGNGVLAIPERLGATARAVQVGAQVAHLLTVLRGAAPEEVVDLVEPWRDHVGVLVRRRELHLGES